MGTIKDSVFDAIKMVEDMMKCNAGDPLRMAQLKIMKWHLTRTLNAMDRIDKIRTKNNDKTR